MRKMERTVAIFDDPEEAERELDRHYAALTPDERMREMCELLNRWGGWNERRLQRVARFVDVE